MSFRALKALCSGCGMACHCSRGLNQPDWKTEAVGTAHGMLCQASSARCGRMGARAGSIPCSTAKHPSPLQATPVHGLTELSRPPHSHMCILLKKCHSRAASKRCELLIEGSVLNSRFCGGISGTGAPVPRRRGRSGQRGGRRSRPQRRRGGP